MLRNVDGTARNIRNLPAWDLSRRDYFTRMTTKFFPLKKRTKDGKEEHELFPSYRIEGMSQRIFCYSEAWDFCGYHREIGQFYIICRQILRMGKIAPYLRPMHVVEYAVHWKQFFNAHPELQTEEAVSVEEAIWHPKYTEIVGEWMNFE